MRPRTRSVRAATGAPGAETQTPHVTQLRGRRPSRPCVRTTGRRARVLLATQGHESLLAEAAQRHPTAQVRTELPEEMGCPDPLRYEAGSGPPSTPPPGPRADGPAPPAPHRATGPAPRAHREPSPPSRRPARPGPRLVAASRDVAPVTRGRFRHAPSVLRRQLPARGWGGAGKGSDALGRAGRACALRWVCSGRGAGLPRLTRDNRGATVLVAFPPAPRWALAVSRLLGPRGNRTFCRLCPPKG